MKFSPATLLLLLPACFAAPRTDEAKADLIQDGLPNQPIASPSQYSGYVSVSDARDLFYYFAESDDETLPLVLWLNGGPGCSSLGGGLSELGPFFAGPNATLTHNEHSWSTVANMVFLESPAGVGFSTSTDASDYTTVGDERTAQDTLEFVRGFLQRFPQYAENDFWITGESYGGHYVPGATKAIVDHNAAAPSDPINIKGFMVGNAWTDAEEDNKGAVEFWHNHALNSDETYNNIVEECDFTNIGPLEATQKPAACDKWLEVSSREMGNINIYEIYADQCLAEQNKDAIHLLEKLGEAHAASNHFADHYVGSNPTPDYEPCIEDFLEAYMNSPAVQTAMHVRPGTYWTQCSSVVDYSYTDLLSSMLPTYEALAGAGIEMIVFSGDVDAIVPVTGTRNWLNKLGLPVVEPWAPWTDSEGQVGGYKVKYDGLTFLTVRDAGHMVPYCQPQRALDFFGAGLKGKL
jgi:serine carboxypeptidase-like clade 2